MFFLFILQKFQIVQIRMCTILKNTNENPSDTINQKLTSIRFKPNIFYLVLNSSLKLNFIILNLYFSN